MAPGRTAATAMALVVRWAAPYSAIGQAVGTAAVWAILWATGMDNVSERGTIAMTKTKRRYVIVRTYSAGCFAGELVKRIGKEVTITNARRLWYWAGAASLSELAVHGTAKPELCKFPVPVSEVELTEAIEIIAVTAEARKSIEGVPVWTAR